MESIIEFTYLHWRFQWSRLSVADPVMIDDSEHRPKSQYRIRLSEPAVMKLAVCPLCEPCIARTVSWDG